MLRAPYLPLIPNTNNFKKYSPTMDLLKINNIHLVDGYCLTPMATNNNKVMIWDHGLKLEYLDSS